MVTCFMFFLGVLVLCCSFWEVLFSIFRILSDIVWLFRRKGRPNETERLQRRAGRTPNVPPCGRRQGKRSELPIGSTGRASGVFGWYRYEGDSTSM